MSIKEKKSKHNNVCYQLSGIETEIPVSVRNILSEQLPFAFSLSMGSGRMFCELRMLERRPVLGLCHRGGTACPATQPSTRTAFLVHFLLGQECHEGSYFPFSKIPFVAQKYA